jgi:hypothetical protein
LRQRGGRFWPNAASPSIMSSLAVARRQFENRLEGARTPSPLRLK